MKKVQRPNSKRKISGKIILLITIPIYSIFYTGSETLAQYEAAITFKWPNIDSTINSLSIGNSSDFWWWEPRPVIQYTTTRSERENMSECKIKLRAPIQQVQVYIIGKTFNLLLEDGDHFDLKIRKQENKLMMELDTSIKDRKRILFFEALNTYLNNLNFSTNTINQKPKNDVLPYLNDISNKSQVFVKNYFKNDKEIYNNVAHKHVEAMILNRIFYFDSTLILPSWMYINDTTNDIQKLDAVTELLKNYGNKLFRLFYINKNTSILAENTAQLKRPFRDYALIVAIDKILTETPNILTKYTIEQLLGIVEDSTHQVYTSKMLAKAFMLGKPIPDSVSNQTYLLPLNSKETISLSEMLSNSKEELIVIDFWASWCGACRLDMQDAVATKKYLDSLKIKVVYISCDREKDRTKWMQASKIEKATKNQFLIMKDFSSPLIKYLNVNYIPRYILFKNGKLVDILFPRLTDLALNDVRNSINRIMSGNN